MALDHIRYDLLVQEALRGVVRTVLADAAQKGLPGDHHFYIGFDTRADGVRLAGWLREKYPEEMTIVLQHQFWDLKVGEHGFEVGLSFNGVPERLAIPFAAIKRFSDPVAAFDLRFETVASAPKQAPKPSKAASDKPERPAQHASTRTQSVPAVPAPAKQTPAPAKPAPVLAASREEGPDKPSGGGEVVRLDRYRKKK